MDDAASPLPQEVLYLIIEHAGKDILTLLRLCLVCRSLLPQAQRVLYNDISLLDTGHNMNRGTPGRKSTMLKCLDTMASHPTLAQNVRSFSYRGRRLRFDWWERMNGALQVMINLKYFTLEGSQLPLANTLLKDCSFQLRSFTWSNYDARVPRPQSPEEECIRQFLSTQNMIRHLSTSFVSTRVSSNICPSLETLIGDTLTIMNVLPGRNTVTKLVWDETQWGNIFNIESISQPLSYVRTFILGGLVPRHSLVTYIPYLGNLETLRLFGKVFPTSLEEELEHITSLPRLRIFIWSPSQSDSPLEYQLGLLSKEQQRAFVTRWFQAIPSFRLAYFARCSPRQDLNCFLRWTRDGVEANATFSEVSREADIDV